MLTNAFALAALTTGGCILVYQKLPRKVRKFVEKHALIADLLALIAIYMLLGGTLTALVAASMCGVFISGLLHVANNPDDFLYLYDLRNFLKVQVKSAQETLNTFGVQYREKKLAEAAEVKA